MASLLGGEECPLSFDLLLELLKALPRSRLPQFPWKGLDLREGIIVPALVLAEVDYFLRQNRAAMRKLIAEIFDPKTRYEYELPLPSDLVRALEFDAKFKELHLGLVDGTVAAIAERRKVYRVLTSDHRDFGTIRVGRHFSLALEVVP